MFDLKRLAETAKRELKKEFPLLAAENLIYLDNAATTQKPAVVLNRLDRFYRQENANVHRGLYELSASATESFEQARETVAEFVGAAPENLVFTGGTTASINLLAQSLDDQIKSGDLIVTTALEHHSNLLPWMQLCARKNAELRLLPVDESGELDFEKFENWINDSRVKVFTLTGVSHVLGNRTSFERLFSVAHARGLLCFLDGAQMGLDLRKIMAHGWIDAVSISGHKLHAPFGVGALAVSDRLMPRLKPPQSGGGMVSKIPESLLLKDVIWNKSPHCFEAGTPPVAEAVAMAEAIRFMTGPLYLEASRLSYIHEIAEGLAQMPGIQLYGWAGKSGFRNAITSHRDILSFNIREQHPHDVAQALADQNIAVRAGFHCAQPLMRNLEQTLTEFEKQPEWRMETSKRSAPHFGTVRVSLSPTTLRSEVDHFLRSIEEISKGHALGDFQSRIPKMAQP